MQVRQDTQLAMTFPFVVFCQYSEQFYVSQAEQFSDCLSGQKQIYEIVKVIHCATLITSSYMSEGYPCVWFCTSPSDSLLYAHARRMHEFMLRNGIPHEYREYSSTARKLDHVFNVLHPEYPESIQANEDIVRFFLDFNQRT